ncbi:MAG: replication initiator protein A [Lachnospiraceae bacterium]
MEYPYFKGLEADQYSFYRVPKALVKADLFQKMSGDAKLLYAVLLDRMSLSIKNGWQDKHGNAYIICTIEEVMDSIHCARQKAVKLLDELEHEFRLIERQAGTWQTQSAVCERPLCGAFAIELLEVRKSYFRQFEKRTSGSSKIKRK